MKTVIREWVSCKKALIVHIAGIICGIISLSIYFYMVDLATRTITGDVNNVKACIWILCYSGGAATLFTVLRNLLQGQDILFNKIYSRFVNKVITADYDMYTKLSCSQIVTASDKMWSISAAGKSILSMIYAIGRLAVSWVAVFLQSPVIAIAVVPIYVFVAYIVRRLSKSWNKIDKDIDNIKRSRNRELDAVINGFVEVRSNLTERRHLESITTANNHIREQVTLRRFISSNMTLVYCGVSYIGLIASVIYSIWAISEGKMTVAAAMAIFVYMDNLIDPLDQIMSYFDDIAANTSILGDYDTIIGYKNTIDDGPIELTNFEDGIRMTNLTFKYNDSDNVLEHVNMYIPRGSHVGICGTSGGGKTTLFKLLQKFYVPTYGAIYIDGLNYTELSTASLREKMALVSQDPYIFDGSIYDNMTYGINGIHTSDMKRQEIITKVKEVAVITGIDDFVSKLPDGYDTLVGPRGIKLSGGQRQRIVFARALLSEPEILLLDEATSALDNISEKTIQDAINKYGKDMTIITIAHRLDTIKSCDKIFVFSEHTVIAEGTHRELMGKCEEYKNMVNAKIFDKGIS